MIRAIVLLLAMMFSSAGKAEEMSQRFSLFALCFAADMETSDSETGHCLQQQSLRFMLDDSSESSSWATHLKVRNQYFSDAYAYAPKATSPFRYQSLSDSYATDCGERDCSRFDYEVDRALYRWQQSQMDLSIGRQAVDWGSGRFWQPLNVFGAFSPTDIDTDFKNGIDVLTASWYPNPFASLTGVYQPAMQGEDSGVLHYRAQFADQLEGAALIGSVIDDWVVGASLEGPMGGFGWRWEMLARQSASDARSLFSIAGMDYQFSDGTVLIVEGYYHSDGVDREQQIPMVSDNMLRMANIRPQLASQLLGVGASKNFLALWQGSYLLLFSVMDDIDQQAEISLLQQVSLTYSLSDESDLLLLWAAGVGKSRTSEGRVRSEFGDIPWSMAARFRLYF
ncbi:MAG: hypothetical protein OEW58_12685 [Gammaproteobacteria bacterium]|nr:hypothetical protein [Gammaproteobacteria bacterium]